jgi:hypothetical protein
MTNDENKEFKNAKEMELIIAELYSKLDLGANKKENEKKTNTEKKDINEINKFIKKIMSALGIDSTCSNSSTSTHTIFNTNTDGIVVPIVRLRPELLSLITFPYLEKSTKISDYDIININAMIRDLIILGNNYSIENMQNYQCLNDESMKVNEFSQSISEGKHRFM